MKKNKPFTNDHALQSSFKVPLSVTEDNLKNWIDKQELMQMLHISERTLQNLRSKNIIPWLAIGGKVYYYLPGILQVLHNNIRNKGNDPGTLLRNMRLTLPGFNILFCTFRTSFVPASYQLRTSFVPASC